MIRRIQGKFGIEIKPAAPGEDRDKEVVCVPKKNVETFEDALNWIKRVVGANVESQSPWQQSESGIMSDVEKQLRDSEIERMMLQQAVRQEAKEIEALAEENNRQQLQYLSTSEQPFNPGQDD